MSTFFEHLNELMHKSRFTLPSLEQESGFTVSMIPKVKNDTRLPDSEEKVLGLIRALHCSIEEERSLMQEYRIEKVGPSTWLCMEECRRAVRSVEAGVPQQKIPCARAAHLPQLPHGNSCRR